MNLIITMNLFNFDRMRRKGKANATPPALPGEGRGHS